MNRNLRCSKEGLKKGAWSAAEDKILRDYVRAHGEGNWGKVPKKAGLNRCPRSCRLRWLNYLRPDIKRGNITVEEEDLIIRLHNLLGNRWSLIAGRLPGRTDNEIKNYWNTVLKKKAQAQSVAGGGMNLKNKETAKPPISETKTSCSEDAVSCQHAERSVQKDRLDESPAMGDFNSDSSSSAPEECALFDTLEGLDTEGHRSRYLQLDLDFFQLLGGNLRQGMGDWTSGGSYVSFDDDVLFDNGVSDAHLGPPEPPPGGLSFGIPLGVVLAGSIAKS